MLDLCRPYAGVKYPDASIQGIKLTMMQALGY